jgi:hypothetical protein
MTAPSAASQAAENLGPVIKEGCGTKQGGHIKTWKKRWFVLRGTSLLYPPKPGGTEKGRIRVNEASVIAKAPECKKNSLLLTSPFVEKAISKFCAPSEVAHLEWSNS